MSFSKGVAGFVVGMAFLALSEAFLTTLSPSSSLTPTRYLCSASRSSGRKTASRGSLRLRASGVPSGEEPMSLSAYDQLVLSVRALTPAEIKQELNTRGISHNDCFEKEELVARLVEARLQIAAEAIGEGEIQVADDDTLETAPIEEEPAEEETVKRDTRVFNEDVMKSLDKEKLQAMMQDQELMQALRNPSVLKMAQEVLKDPSQMDKFSGDPDVLVAIEKVKSFLQSAGSS